MQARGKLCLFLFLTSLALCGCGKRGSGIEATQVREVEEFSRIEVNGGFTVNLAIAEERSLTITGDDNLLDLVDTHVDDGLLVVETTESLRPDLPLELAIATPSIRELFLRGGIAFTLPEYAGDYLSINCEGACSGTVDGRVRELRLIAAGAADIDAEELIAIDGFIEIQGAGDAVVCVSGNLNAQIDGAGSIKYGCSPRSVSKSVDGVGVVEPL